MVFVRECSVHCEFTQLENVSVYSGGSSVYCSHLLENRIDKVMSTAIPGEVWTSTSAEQVLHLGLVKETVNQGDLLDELKGGRPKMSEETIQNVKDRLQASPKKSLRRLTQESGLSRSTWQRAAKKRSFMRTVSPCSTN